MSSSASTVDRGHPTTAACARMHAELDALVEQPAWSLDPHATRETLVALTRLVDRVSELELKVAAHADRTQVGELTGATSTGSWWAHATRQTRSGAHRRMRLASGLDAHEETRAALARGEVRVEQARVIVDAVDALPEACEQAEKHLLAEAAHHDAKALKVLGRRVFEVVAPKLADAHEAALLEKEERDAAAAARFTMSDDGHGKAHGRFTLPSLQGAMLRKALLAIAAPKHQAAIQGGVRGRRPGPERMGLAFAEYVETHPVDRLPTAGGVAATVVVTMPLGTLLGGLRAASLDTGETISAGEARRLACGAGIIPAVLGTDSGVLDLGRQTRFHTKPQRIALGLREGGCTAEGCDWPPGLCHAHHEVPFSRGGGTSVANGRLLCPRHHARAHDPTYETRHLPGGKVAFHRRT